jgi:hypothetical protein
MYVCEITTYVPSNRVISALVPHKYLVEGRTFGTVLKLLATSFPRPYVKNA